MACLSRVQYIVDALLEALPEAELLPPRYWPNFRYDKHGRAEYEKWVKFEDRFTFLNGLLALTKVIEVRPVMVPADKWTLKMPLGYGIIGKGNISNSVMDITETPPNTNILDNPGLDPQTNARWRKGL